MEEEEVGLAALDSTKQSVALRAPSLVVYLTIAPWQGTEYHYDDTHADMAFMPAATIEGKYKTFAARQAEKAAK